MHPAPQPATNPQYPVTMGLQPVIIIRPPSSPVLESYKTKHAIGLGSVQIAVGILCFIFQSALIGTEFNVWQGYWCGIFVSSMLCD